MAIKNRRTRIKHSIRNKISGTPQRPRLSVYRSNSAIYAQIIDDLSGITLVNASSAEISKDKKSVNIQTSKEVGITIAKKAIEKGISQIVFDRNGYLYHGKVKALAEGAREGGLNF